jgi:hypothetical protein
MATGISLDGTAPRTATTTEANTDPTVSAGVANFSNLTKGGLFTLVANAKRPLVVEAIDNPGTATLTLVDRTTQTRSRAVPSVPFKVSPNEVFKAVGGAAGSYVGFLYRIDGEKIL